MALTISIDSTDNHLVVRIPIDPHDSASGKSTVLATTEGNKETP